MYNEHNSLTFKYQITRDELTYRKNQSIKMYLFIYLLIIRKENFR